MTKIGIIRCQENSNRCAGHNCFPAIYNRTGYMAEYDAIELVGFDTCGGCPGPRNFDKIVDRGLRLEKDGAEVIHLGTCLVLFCPNKDKFKAALEEKISIPIKEKTHTRPQRETAAEGSQGSSQP